LNSIFCKHAIKKSEDSEGVEPLNRPALGTPVQYAKGSFYTCITYCSYQKEQQSCAFFLSELQRERQTRQRKDDWHSVLASVVFPVLSTVLYYFILNIIVSIIMYGPSCLK